MPTNSDETQQQHNEKVIKKMLQPVDIQDLENELRKKRKPSKKGFFSKVVGKRISDLTASILSNLEFSINNVAVRVMTEEQTDCKSSYFRLTFG